MVVWSCFNIKILAYLLKLVRVHSLNLFNEAVSAAKSLKFLDGLLSQPVVRITSAVN